MQKALIADRHYIGIATFINLGKFQYIRIITDVICVILGGVIFVIVHGTFDRVLQRKVCQTVFEKERNRSEINVK